MMDDCFSQRMLRTRLGRSRQSQQFRFSEPVRRDDPRHGRLATCQRTGLVEDDRVDPACCLSASPPLTRMPCSAALPVPTMIAVGVAGQRAWTGDDQDESGW